jgi:hypothetical protein
MKSENKQDGNPAKAKDMNYHIHGLVQGLAIYITFFVLWHTCHALNT